MWIKKYERKKQDIFGVEKKVENHKMQDKQKAEILKEIENEIAKLEMEIEKLESTDAKEEMAKHPEAYFGKVESEIAEDTNQRIEQLRKDIGHLEDRHFEISNENDEK